MAYKLNKEWFEDNKEGLVKFIKTGSRADFTTEKGISDVSKNKKVLKELFDIGKPYVIYEDNKKPAKNKKVNGIKEAASKKEGQVSTKASEEE
tara:strand:- start:2897 stop:3175 length:279 start_codon:yes stop_codon:yes gene_type:complete